MSDVIVVVPATPPSEDSAAPPSKWPLYAITGAGVAVGIALVTCAGFASWEGLDFYIDPTQLLGKLAPLLLAAAFIERAIEVLVSPWRDTGASRRQVVLDHAKAAEPPDPIKVGKASEDLNDYRGRTQQYAFAVALVLGAAAASVGVRALWPLLRTANMNGAQKIAFDIFDITLSAVMLAGGAAGIHSAVTAFTSFFDATGEKARQSAATPPQLPTS